MEQLPIEVKDIIFSYTDLNTCILNNKNHIIKHNCMVRKIIFEKNITMNTIKYCFEHFLPEIINSIKFSRNEFLKYFVKFNDTDIIEYIISQYIKHRIFTKCFSHELIRAFETACCIDIKLNVGKFIYTNYIYKLSGVDYIWISEMVIKRGANNVILWLHSIDKLCYCYREIKILERRTKNETIQDRLKKNETIQLLESIKKSIPHKRHVYKN